MVSNRFTESVFKTRKTHVGAVALALLAVVLPACTNNQQGGETTTPQAQESPVQEPPQAEESPTTAGEVARNFEDYIGETVTVRGEVDREEELGENAFRLEAGAPFTGDILIVGAAAPAEDGAATDNVQITGEVREFTAAEAQQYNLNLPADQASEYEGQPMIVADNVALSPSPNEIADNPEVFTGQTVAVEGNLEEVSPNTYTLSGGGIGGGELLVILPNAEQAPAGTEDVVVMGQVEPFDAAQLQQQYQVTWDEQQQQELADEYSDQPIIVAQQIESREQE